MALTGVHVECCVAGQHFGKADNPVLGAPVWTETLATEGTTTEAAPSGSGPYVFRVTASAACYVTIDTGTPDSSDDPRHYVPAEMPMDFVAAPGAKLDWTAA